MLNIYILTQPETLKIGHEQRFDQSKHYTLLSSTNCAFYIIVEIQNTFFVFLPNDEN